MLEEGALQPVINLLNSDCPDSQRESALLLGQFATADADTKARIVQRGAVPALVRMLGQPDVSLKEMAAFALGRLAQNMDNQVGVGVAWGRDAGGKAGWEGGLGVVTHAGPAGREPQGDGRLRAGPPGAEHGQPGGGREATGGSRIAM